MCSVERERERESEKNRIEAKIIYKIAFYFTVIPSDLADIGWTLIGQAT